MGGVMCAFIALEFVAEGMGDQGMYWFLKNMCLNLSCLKKHALISRSRNFIVNLNVQILQLAILAGEV